MHQICCDKSKTAIKCLNQKNEINNFNWSPKDFKKQGLIPVWNHGQSTYLNMSQYPHEINKVTKQRGNKKTLYLAKLKYFHQPRFPWNFRGFPLLNPRGSPFDHTLKTYQCQRPIFFTFFWIQGSNGSGKAKENKSNHLPEQFVFENKRQGSSFRSHDILSCWNLGFGWSKSYKNSHLGSWGWWVWVWVVRFVANTAVTEKLQIATCPQKECEQKCSCLNQTPTCAVIRLQILMCTYV